MDIEILITTVKQLSDEEIADILDRLDDEKAQLGTECDKYCLKGDSDAAYECMEQYLKIDKLRNFMRSLHPLKVPEKKALGKKSCENIIPFWVSNAKQPLGIKQVTDTQKYEQTGHLKKTWELYCQGERKV